VQYQRLTGDRQEQLARQPDRRIPGWDDGYYILSGILPVMLHGISAYMALPQLARLAPAPVVGASAIR
jgi:hypothetical protein